MKDKKITKPKVHPVCVYLKDDGNRRLCELRCQYCSAKPGREMICLSFKAKSNIPITNLEDYLQG